MFGTFDLTATHNSSYVHEKMSKVLQRLFGIDETFQSTLRAFEAMPEPAQPLLYKAQETKRNDPVRIESVEELEEQTSKLVSQILAHRAKPYKALKRIRKAQLLNNEITPGKFLKLMKSLRMGEKKQQFGVLVTGPSQFCPHCKQLFETLKVVFKELEELKQFVGDVPLYQMDGVLNSFEKYRFDIVP